jgi:Tfp pilus assembly pilus retraction ATPase PilT
MYKLETFLEAAERYEASDIHLSTGEHPRMRIKTPKPKRKMQQAVPE